MFGHYNFSGSLAPSRKEMEKIIENLEKLRPLILKALDEDINRYSSFYGRQKNLSQEEEMKIKALLFSFVMQLVLDGKIIIKRRLEDGKKEWVE